MEGCASHLCPPYRGTGGKACGGAALPRRASPANFASLVRVPLRFAKGRYVRWPPPLSFGHFPRRAGESGPPFRPEHTPAFASLRVPFRSAKGDCLGFPSIRVRVYDAVRF